MIMTTGYAHKFACLLQVASLSLGGGGPGLNGETCATTTDGFRAAICAASNAGEYEERALGR
jgi:hypothetical protein